MKKALVVRLILVVILIAVLVFSFLIVYPKQQAAKHFNLAVAAYNQGDLQTAIREYQKAIEFKPLFPEVYHNLTIVFAESEQADATIQTALKGLQINPMDTELHYYLAAAYEKKGLVTQAISEYKTYIQSAPNVEFSAEANSKIALLEQKPKPAQSEQPAAELSVEEKLQKVNQDLNAINEALRQQHAAITATRATSQNAP